MSHEQVILYTSKIFLKVCSTSVEVDEMETEACEESDDFDSDDYDIPTPYDVTDEEDNKTSEDDNVFKLSAVQPRSPHENTKCLKPFAHLPILEIVFYFVCFWSAAVYSLYRFYKTSQRWGQYLELTKIENSWFSSRQDQADLEWFVWTPALLKLAPWAFLHIILAQIIRKHFHQHLAMFYIAYSVAILLSFIGLAGTVICFFVPLVMFVVLATRLKLLVWMTWCLILIVFNTFIFNSVLDLLVSDIPDGDYKVSVMVAWIILRSLSLSLDICDTDPNGSIPHTTLLTTLLAYCFYLPFLMTGPFMPFADFQNGLTASYQNWSIKKLIYFGGQLLRFLWWMYFTNILLYYFYAHSMNFSQELVSRMTSWSLAGFSYFLMMFFNLKYVVLYGLPATFARMENYEPPPHPRCCLLTYRFSDIWRYFDQGLYRFMIKHIYVPWIQHTPTIVRKIQGIMLVFTFVYVWHGVNPQVFWWSVINFIGVTTEKTASIFSQTSWYCDWESKWLSDTWKRRFYGLLAVGLYVPSVASLIIFLSSMENASTVAKRIFNSGFPNVTVSMFFFMFCLGQCSMEVQNWRSTSYAKSKSS